MAAVNVTYNASIICPINLAGQQTARGSDRTNSLRARCEVLPALFIKMPVFWDV